MRFLEALWLGFLSESYRLHDRRMRQASSYMPSTWTAPRYELKPWDL